MTDNTEDNDRTFNGARRCKAKSSRSGQRCKAPAMAAQEVCQAHGGSSPQARAKAQLRLLALVDPAIEVLATEMDNAENASSERQAAANSILDRAGYSRTHNVTTTDARDLLTAKLLEAVAANVEPEGIVEDHEPTEG